MAKVDIPGMLVLHDVLSDGEQTSQSDLFLIGEKGILCGRSKTVYKWNIIKEYKNMRSMVKDYVGAKWILFNGNRIVIKRELLKKWLDNQNAI